MTATVHTENPYVGPRAFHRGESLYGRDRELVELLDLLLAERIVLLHSPSGAGKTSMVQAMLVDRLQEEGFETFPVIRVGAEPPPGTAHGIDCNRYVLSVLMSLEQSVPPDQRTDIATLAGMSIDRYLTARPLVAENRVLIFDQFEEVLHDPTDQTAKREFFNQLADALRPRERWALFLARDDYVAALDQYLKMLPTRVRTRFRIDILDRKAARQAIQRPAEQGGAPFAEDAVTKLINDLSQVWVQQSDGSSQPKPGPSVEPVQLQVVCLRLWERLGPGRTEILASDLESAGTVDSALSSYYARQVAEIAYWTGTSERAIRDWFDTDLIVEQRFRGQTRRGPPVSADGGRRVLLLLEDAHLVRAEARLGSTWFELAHDRLVAPIRDDNARWRQLNLNPLQRQALIWSDEGRPDNMLLGDRDRAAAEAWAAEHGDDLTRLEADFLAAGRGKAAREKRHRLLNRILVLVTVVAVLLAFVTIVLARQTAHQARMAEHSARVAEAGELLSRARAELDIDPQQSVREGLDALARNGGVLTPEIRDVLHRAVDTSRIRATLRDPAAPDVSYADLALSPDETLLATAGSDERVRIWDVATLRLRRTLAIGAWTARVAFGEGNRLAVTTEKGAEIWDPTTGAKLLAFTHGDPVADVPVNGVALELGSRRIATAADDGTVRIWASDTGQPGAVLPLGGTTKGWSVAFDGRGQLVATGGSDGSVALWDATTGQRLHDLRGHTQNVDRVAFSPDGTQVLAASEDRTARIWDAASGRLVTTFVGHGNSVFWADFTLDGEHVITTGADGSARVWDRVSGAQLLTLTGHTNPIGGAALSRSGTTLFTASWDGSIKIWDASVLHDDTVLGLAFQPPSGRLLATSSADRLARLWNIRPPPTAGCGDVMSHGPLDTGNGARTTIRGHDGQVGAVAFNPAGTLLATSSDDDSTVQVWDVATGQLVTTLGQAEQAGDLAWSPDGRLLAAASSGGVDVWDVYQRTQQHLADLDPSIQLVNSVSFNAEGTVLASADNYGRVTLWDTTTYTWNDYWWANNGHIFTVAFSPRAGTDLLATASVDRTAVLMNSAGQEIHRFPYEDVVSDVAFSPDGAQIAIASWDRTVKLWDVSTYALQATITHSAQVMAVAFSPDGRLLATTTVDHAVHVYDLDDDDLLAAARCRAVAG